MRRVKQVVAVNPEKTYTIYEQRQPLKKQQGDRIIYEANLVRVGEIQAKTPHEAMDKAKKLGLSDKPVIWGPDTESMKDCYNRQRRQYDE